MDLDSLLEAFPNLDPVVVKDVWLSAGDDIQEVTDMLQTIVREPLLLYLRLTRAVL